MTAATYPTDLPLMFLQPVVDGRHAWAALLLESPTALDRDALVRLFGELGLSEALHTLACIVATANPDPFRDAAESLQAERIVLRLPVDRCLQPDQCAVMAHLEDSGFRLMAEGLPSEGRELCPQVKAIALAGPPSPAIDFLARHAGPHLALAVESPQRFLRCRDAGFHWFAGNYPLHPDGEPLPRGAIRHALLLQLLALIAHDADSHDIEAVIKQDAHLSYQLLKLVNSVAFSLTTTIDSFGQAITLLGRRQLQRWLQLLLYARPEVGSKSPLMPRAALRAGLMEALSDGPESRDRAFMVGAFSLLDVFFGMNLGTILKPLNIADDVRAALVDHAGPLGTRLRIVEAAEAGDAATLTALLAEAGLDHRAWALALVKAYHWAIRVSLEA